MQIHISSLANNPVITGRNKATTNSPIQQSHGSAIPEPVTPINRTTGIEDESSLQQKRELIRGIYKPGQAEKISARQRKALSAYADMLNQPIHDLSDTLAKIDFFV